MKILVHTQVLKTKQSSVQTSLDDFTNYALTAKNVFSDMGNYWQGADFNLFKTKTDEFVEQINRLEKSMETYNAFIKEYNKAVIDNDNYYEKRAISLK